MAMDVNQYILMFFCSSWVLSVGISMYGTYCLYEYGPRNTNLIWNNVRNWTDPISCVMFGMAVAWYFGKSINWNLFDLFIVFLVSFYAGNILLYIAHALIVSPYQRYEEERSRYFDAMEVAKYNLRQSGLWPEQPNYFDSPEDWEKWHAKIDALRNLGKLPLIPKCMQKK